MRKQQPAIQIAQVEYGDDDFETIIAIIFDMLEERQLTESGADQHASQPVKQHQIADYGQEIYDA